MNVTGIILCGGASRRMGRPKALLEFGGETFLDRLIRIFQGCCDKVVLVLGHDAETIRAGSVRAATVECVVNPRYAEGQLSSLQRGLEEAGEAGAVLFTPVDYPAIRLETVQTLCQAIREAAGDHLVFIPRYAGRHGHPAGFLACLIPEFFELPPGATARDVIHRHRARTRYVDVEDPGILRDIDDPAGYETLLRQEGP